MEKDAIQHEALCEKENKETGEKEVSHRPWSVTVFHVSQTDVLQ